MCIFAALFKSLLMTLIFRTISLRRNSLKFAFLVVLLCVFYSLPLVSRVQPHVSSTDLPPHIITLKKGERAFTEEDYPNALRYFSKAKAEAEKARDFLTLFKATYDIGISYFMISDNSEALQYYYQARQIVEQHQLGWEPESKIMNAVAGVYFEENNYDKASEICSQCYQKAVQHADSSLVFTNAIDLANLANKKKDFGKAMQMLEQARRWMKKADRDELMCVANTTYIETLFLQQKYDEVIEVGEALIKNKHLKKGDKATIIIYLINCYTKKGNATRAFQLTKDATDITPLRSRPELCNIISELFQTQGNLAQALTYKDSVVIYRDSLLQIQNRKQTEIVRTQVEVYKVKADMQREVEQLAHHRQIAILVSVIALLLLAIALLFFLFHRQKSKQQAQHMLLQIEQEKNVRLVAEQQMHETELIARYQREIMQKEIERKRKEIAATTMFVTSRNELINELLQSIALFEETKDNQLLNKTTNHLKQLLKTGDQQEDFLVHFEEANPDFVQTLRTKHPTLSVSDVRFLAYVRMGLTMKEMSTLMNIEPESCKRRKNRIAKKLQIDTAADLYRYISEL